jgi:hypothetical protein
VVAAVLVVEIGHFLHNPKLVAVAVVLADLDFFPPLPYPAQFL